ncbi:conserved hypothetical protein [Vibrio aestuarianus]|nr:conserved hypothetical protein [Vibrio aestuarianus]
MRNRLWDNLQNTKFKSAYLSEVSKRSYYWGNAYSFILAFGSAGSVAAWAVWKDFPTVWAAVVAFSQFLHIAKPYLPFLKNERDFFEMGHQYEILYLSYEKLWFKYEKGQLSDDEVEKEYYRLRSVELNNSNRFKGIYCPTFIKLTNKVSDEISEELTRTFY